MDASFDIDVFKDIDSVLNQLKPYQRNSLSFLIKSNTPEETAKIWFLSNGPAATQKFGGDNKVENITLYESLCREFKYFVCGNEKYKDEREKLAQLFKPTELLIVSTISACLATHLGLAISMITPIVALLLHVVSKTGINAWCSIS